MIKQGSVLSALLVIFVLVAGRVEQVSKRSYANNVYGFSLNPLEDGMVLKTSYQMSRYDLLLEIPPTFRRLLLSRLRLVKFVR